jgi:hypothetical protein
VTWERMVASAQLYPFHFARSGLVTRVDMLATPKTQVVEQIMVTGARIELAARALKVRCSTTELPGRGWERSV